MSDTDVVAYSCTGHCEEKTETDTAGGSASHVNLSRNVFLR